MKSFFLLLSTALATPVFAQSPANPAVQVDGRVTFHLKAPGAKEVRLQCEGLPAADMQRDDQGVWSRTVGPLEPDYYGYSFVVDGLRVMDPANALNIGRSMLSDDMPELADAVIESIIERAKTASIDFFIDSTSHSFRRCQAPRSCFFCGGDEGATAPLYPAYHFVFGITLARYLADQA